MRSAAGRELEIVEPRRSYLPLLAAAGTCAAAAVGFASAPMRLANARVDGAALMSIAACQTVAAIAVLGSTLPRRAWPAIALVVTNLFAIVAWGSADSWGSPPVAFAFDRPDVLARGCAAVGFLAAISSARELRVPTQRAVVALGVAMCVGAGGLAIVRLPVPADAPTTAAAASQGEEGRDAVRTPSITEIYADAPLGMDMAGMAHDMTKPMCAPASGQIQAADQLVAATTVGLLRYRGVDAAVDAGYVPVGFEPNGVFRYENLEARLDPATLEPTRPETILFGSTPSGTLMPIAAMYVATSPERRGPRVGGCLTPWHRRSFPFVRSGAQSPEMITVWTVAVPGGPYAAHVEAEYERIYLGRDPYVASSTDAFERLAAAVAGTDAEPSAALAALTQYRSALCAEMTRGALTSLTGDGKLLEVVCDPVRNPPLPGLRPPGWTTVAAALRSAGVPIG